MYGFRANEQTSVLPAIEEQRHGNMFVFITTKAEANWMQVAPITQLGAASFSVFKVEVFFFFFLSFLLWHWGSFCSLWTWFKRMASLLCRQRGSSNVQQEIIPLGFPDCFQMWGYKSSSVQLAPLSSEFAQHQIGCRNGCECVHCWVTEGGERDTFSAGIWEICVKRPWRSSTFWSTVDRFVDTFAFILICASSSSLSHAENQVSRLKTGLSLFTLLFSPILEQILRSLYWLCLSRAAQLSPTFMLTPKHVCVCVYMCVSMHAFLFTLERHEGITNYEAEIRTCVENILFFRQPLTGQFTQDESEKRFSEPPPLSQAHIWILKWKSFFFFFF